MRKPTSIETSEVVRLAIRARTTGTVGDAATLCKYVAKVFGVSYDRAAEVCVRKYQVIYAEAHFAGRVSMYTAKNPSKDMLAVRFDKSTISEERIPEFVPADLLAAI